ncbi:tail fiber protein [Xenorhabdus griffiniae]|uniref:tail fiber protein n=1 Tax=Xenorhabdus griffiniae TaxID=351672 RepID=UPI0030D098FF
MSSDSEANAATPKAVKIAYDLVNTANQNASNTNENANTRLSKDQNGANVLDKAAFVKNLGLSVLVTTQSETSHSGDQGQSIRPCMSRSTPIGKRHFDNFLPCTKFYYFINHIHLIPYVH